MSWRAWLAFGHIGGAAVFAYRSDWLAVVMAAAVALVPVVRWVRGEFAATRAVLRESATAGTPEAVLTSAATGSRAAASRPFPACGAGGGTVARGPRRAAARRARPG